MSAECGLYYNNKNNFEYNILCYPSTFELTIIFELLFKTFFRGGKHSQDLMQ